LTLLVADMNTLEAFHRKCQRQILDVCWWVRVSNAEVLQRSGLSPIGDILHHRRLSMFGHVARLDPGVPAHDALRMHVKNIVAKAHMRANAIHRCFVSKDRSSLLLVSCLC